MISFTMPEELGTTLIINHKDQYELHAGGKESLTDSFLDALMGARNEDTFTYTLYDNNCLDEADPVHLAMDSQCLRITYCGETKEYPVSKNEFTDTFFASVRKYSMYYAAPCNYMMHFTRSFDSMVKKMMQYKPLEEKLLQKLDSYGYKPANE
ncbi:MAG: hypothetical protein LUI12_05865 [Clostridiales bacterium]|nr:hypothetical protein [Clostridiales bacterium]